MKPLQNNLTATGNVGMTSICIIGNSHLGALAQSEQGNRLFKERSCELVYWGAAGTLFPKIYYKDGILVSPNQERSKIISAGRYGDLTVDDFDIIVFYGCHIDFYNQARSCVSLLAKDNKPRSAAFCDGMIADYIRQWWEKHDARRLIETVWHHHPDKNFVVSPQPMLATSARHLDGIQDRDLFRRVLSAFDDYLDTWCAEKRGQYLRQNPATMDDERVSTDLRYTRGSIKMEAGQPHPEDDLAHMNGAYGDYVMNDLAVLVDRKISEARLSA